MANNDIFNVNYYNSIGFPTDFRRLHSHSFDEISLVVQGDIRYISDSIMERVKGRSIIFSKAYHLHNPYINQNEAYERYQLAFRHSVLSDKILMYADTDCFILPIVNDKDFEELLGYMKALCNSSQTDELSDTKQHFVLNALMAKIIQIYRQNKHQPQKITHSYISGVIDYIQNNYNQKLVIENIAAEFFVCRAKLIKDFEYKTGMTVSHFISLTRIKYAKEYLKKGMSVTATAELCGFANSGYFIKVFERFNNITPLKYQQMLLSPEPCVKHIY